ncbi:MAG: fumarate hydratase [Lawsonibacter sp.]
MRTIQAAAITETVAKLCIQANTHLPGDIVAALDAARQSEPWPLARETLGLLWDNLGLAEREEPARLPGHGHGLCVRGAGPGDPHRGRVRGGHP